MMAANAGERSPVEITGLGILSAKQTTPANTASPARISGGVSFFLATPARKSLPASMPIINSGRRTSGLKLRMFFQKSVVSGELTLSRPSGWRTTYPEDSERLASHKASMPIGRLVEESFLQRDKRKGKSK